MRPSEEEGEVRREVEEEAKEWEKMNMSYKNKAIKTGG